jgi:hypothetical protein
VALDDDARLIGHGPNVADAVEVVVTDGIGAGRDERRGENQERDHGDLHGHPLL